MRAASFPFIKIQNLHQKENSIYRLMIFQSGVFLQNFVSVTTVLKQRRVAIIKLHVKKHCKNCGIIEDEAHFILKCKVNQNLRESLFNNIELDNEFFFLNFSDEQKLVYLLNPASIRHVRVIGFYLKRSLELRTSLIAT